MAAPKYSSQHSAFLTYDDEIGLPMNATDPTIIEHVADQNECLGIDRLVITRDTKFHTWSGADKLKIIILIDKTGMFSLYDMKQNQLCDETVAKAVVMSEQPAGIVEFVDCSRHYK